MTDHPHANTHDSIAQGPDFNDILSELSDPANSADFPVPTPYELNNLKCLYWEADKTPIRQNKDTNCFLHINIQCLNAKFDNLKIFLNTLSNENFDNLPVILALSEAWLTEHNEASFELSGFHSPISKVRKDNSGRGGVALYVREDFEFIERPDLDKFIPFVFESTFVTLKHLNLTVGAIYRSPTPDSTPYLNEYIRTLSQLAQLKENALLLGDFNQDLLKYNRDAAVTEFADLNFEYGCIPLITKPTRIDVSSATCIDNIITSKLFPSSEAGIIIDGLSDHFPVFYSITDPSYKRKRNAMNDHFTYRDFSEENMATLNNDLSRVNWDNITSEEDPNLAAAQFNDILSTQINLACPLKTRKAKI